MTGKVNGYPGQAALGVGYAHGTTACDESNGQFGDISLCEGFEEGIADCRVIGDVELTRGLGLEALLAVPGHVVDDHERAVCEEQVIEQAGANDYVVGLFDHMGQDGV